jgi:hypothetical protein
VTVLREVGIAACPRCAAIHGSDDRFCPGCGLAFDTKADRPMSSAPVNAQANTAAPTQTSPATPTPATPPAATPPRPPSRTGAPTPATASPAAPTPASPASESPSSPVNPEQRKSESAQEDEPTQVLRPPARGA